MDFLNAPEHEVLYSGAWGSGKTRGLCYKLLQHAVIPGNFVGLCRKELKWLKSTTLRTLLEEDGSEPPVLPRGTYTHNRSESRIHLHGGGTIYYFGFDDPNRVASLNLGAVAIDEGIQLEELEYTMLLSRVRNAAAHRLQVFTATNPGPRSHFLYERFNIDHETPADRRVIRTKSTDNTYLPKVYLKMLEKMKGQYYKRYVLGEWGDFEGLIYGGWDEREFVKEPEGERACRVYAGVDEGFANPFAVVVAKHFENGDVHIVDEVYESGLIQREHIQRCVALQKRWNPEEWFVDPSSPGLITALNNEGVCAIGADNAILPGITAVQDLIATGNLYISPRCKNLLKERGSYQWREGKDEPVKENDHAIDALRYLVQGIRVGDAMFAGRL